MTNHKHLVVLAIYNNMDSLFLDNCLLSNVNRVHSTFPEGKKENRTPHPAMAYTMNNSV